jgi:hypothetical protein
MALSKYQQAAKGFLPVTSARGRSKTPDFEGDTRITPVASPTNQFVQVGPTPKSELYGLASALSEFEGSLGGLIADRQKEQDEADIALAEKQFYEDNEVPFAEAVRTGRIPAYASPAFVKSYKAAEGRKVARDVTASVVQNYETWDGKDADDASGYSPWIADQVRQGLAGINDPEVLKSALPGIRQVAERKGAEHSEYVGRRVMDRAVEGIGKDIIGAIDNATGEPVPGPDGKLITYEGLSDAITASVAEGRRIGIPEDRLNKVAAEAVVSRAIAARDYDLLKAIPEDIAKTPYAAKLITESHDKIGSLLYQDETRAERLDKLTRTRAKDDATRSVIDILTKDIDAEIPEETLAQGETGDPAFRLRAEELRGKLRTNAATVNPQQEIDASLRIHMAEDPVAQAVKEIEAGNIGNPARVNSILYTAQRLKQSKDRGSKSIISSPAVKQYERALRDRYASKDDPLSVRETVDEQAFGSALVDYHIALTEWEETNPNASTIERMRAAREIGEEMLKVPRSVGEDKFTAPEPQRPPAEARPAQVRQRVQQAPEEQRPAAPASVPAQRDPLIDELRRANPALQGLPDAVIRKYLPPASGASAPGKQSAAEPAQRGTQFERVAGTPFSVPMQEPPRVSSRYAGPTYEPPSPDETIEVDGEPVVYAAEPGNTYSRVTPQPVQGVVFHHTSSNADADRQVAYGQRVDRARGFKAGYSFYIDRAGNIIQGAPLSARTNHVQPGRSRLRSGRGDLDNGNTLGIALLGDGKNPTPAQMKAALRLGQALITKYGIPSANIFGHGELQRNREGTEGLDIATALRNADNEG